MSMMITEQFPSLLRHISWQLFSGNYQFSIIQYSSALLLRS